MIGGTPTATAAARTVTIVVTDNAGNTWNVTIELLAVDECTAGSAWLNR